MKSHYRLLFSIILLFLLQDASASYSAACAYRGNVTSEPEVKFYKRNKGYYLVFDFNVASAALAKGGWDPEYCTKQTGNTIKVELQTKSRRPKITISKGDQIDILHSYSEMECVYPNGGSGVCSWNSYKLVTPERKPEK